MNEQFSNWLASGESSPIQFRTNNMSFFFFRVAKNADFDYLYCQSQYQNDALKRDTAFKYAGIYHKPDGLIYDGQYDLRCACGEADTDSRNVQVLQKRLQETVRHMVETAVGNDRHNLQVTGITSKEIRNRLDLFITYNAKTNARSAYLEGADLEEWRFRCDYSPDNWTEESLLSYISDPVGYAEAEAAAYMEKNHESMLSDFLENDALMAEYRALLADTQNPVHRVKKIMAAVGATSAKTVNIVINMEGVEFSFKAEAGPLRRDCGYYYSTYTMMAADRRGFERIFGRSADYRPEHIIRITYGRNVLYEACE